MPSTTQGTLLALCLILTTILKGTYYHLPITGGKVWLREVKESYQDHILHQTALSPCKLSGGPAGLDSIHYIAVVVRSWTRYLHPQWSISPSTE